MDARLSSQGPSSGRPRAPRRSARNAKPAAKGLYSRDVALFSWISGSGAALFSTFQMGIILPLPDPGKCRLGSGLL